MFLSADGVFFFFNPPETCGVAEGPRRGHRGCGVTGKKKWRYCMYIYIYTRIYVKGHDVDIADAG